MRWGKTAFFTAVSALLFFGLASSPLRADPIVRLVGAIDWSAAIADGRVQGLSLDPNDSRFDQNTAALDAIYAGQSAGYRDTAVSTNNSPVNGLVSTYGTTADTGASTIGAWSYIGPDPDFTNSQFKMDIFLTQVGLGAGFDRAAFALIDDNNRVKAWGWDAAALVVGHQEFSFALNDGAGAGGSTFFVVDPLFDITHVVALQGSFRGTLTSSFPPIDLPGPTALQAGTHKLLIVPEGSSGLLLLVSMAALGVLVRCRSQARSLYSR